MILNKFAKWGPVPAHAHGANRFATVLTRGLATLDRQQQLLDDVGLLRVAQEAHKSETKDQIDNLVADTRCRFDEVQARLDALDTIVKQPPPVRRRPSRAAQIVLWSLRPAREALCDQGDPSFNGANELLKRARTNNKTVAKLRDWLVGAAADLAPRYAAQFNDLLLAQRFEEERRERLAELNEFEHDVLMSLGDDTTPRLEVDVQPAAKPPVATTRARRA